MIHLVYPHGPRRAYPWAIGNHLASELRARGHAVRQYQWDETGPAVPTSPDDILLGHPHPGPGRVFEASLEHGWRRVVAMMPWGGRDLSRRMIDRISADIDGFIAICGPYWATQIPTAWYPKVIPCDLAIDVCEYPAPRTGFNPPGQRRAVYIGCTEPSKGTAYLEQIIERTPGLGWAHIGPGSVRGCEELGYLPLDVDPRPLAAFDFLVCCGSNDANPGVVLEAACWGLIPLAVKTCGWIEPMVGLLESGDPSSAAATLARWQRAPIPLLERRSVLIRSLVEERYTWRQFADRVLSALV